jgi:hypothetical protein
MDLGIWERLIIGRYVLVGYSQGAVVHHRAAREMVEDKTNYLIFDRIIATVTFGDGGQQATLEKDYASPVGIIPAWPKELDGKTMFNCNGKDLVSRRFLLNSRFCKRTRC